MCTKLVFGIIGLVLMPILLFAGQASDNNRPVVGVILTKGVPCHEKIHSAFLSALEREMVDPPVKIIVQEPAPGIMAWRNAARRFQVLEVDLIVVYGTSAALAVLDEEHKIPVVYAYVSDPDAVGLKGTNATGIVNALPISASVRYLHALTGFQSLGVLYSSMEPETVHQAVEAENQAVKLNASVVKYNLKKICRNFETPEVDALFITTSCVAATCAQNILDKARKARIPSAVLHCGFQHHGALVSICGNAQSQGEALAIKVAALLTDKTPKSLEVVKNKRNELIINIIEAQNLGLNIPVELLMTATKLIK